VRRACACGLADVRNAGFNLPRIDGGKETIGRHEHAKEKNK
jgi:hypothetical protein